MSSTRAHNSGFLSPTAQARSASKNLSRSKLHVHLNQQMSRFASILSIKQVPSNRDDNSLYDHINDTNLKEYSNNENSDYDSNHQGINLMPVNVIPRVNSLNAIPLLFGPGAKIVSNVYHIIWKAMHTLAADPHPHVSSAAQLIVEEIVSRSFSGMSIESLKESKSNSSISESSSPNTGATFSISESPPSTLAAAAYRRNLTDQSVAANTTTAISAPALLVNQSQQHTVGYPTQSNNNQNSTHQQQQISNDHLQKNNNNINDHSQSNQVPNATVNSDNNIDRITKSANVAICKSRRYASSRDNNMSEDDSRSNMSSQKPLITTEFVDWCTKYFVDPESTFSTSARGATNKEDQHKEWRMLRVLSYKNVCLRELMVLDPARFNESVTNYKVQQIPNLIAVHPYDPIMVFAGRDEFSVMHLDGSHANNYTNHDSMILTSTLTSGSNHHSGILSGVVGASGGNHHSSSLQYFAGGHHYHQHHHGLNGSGDGNPNDLIGTQSNCHTNSSHITSLQFINPQHNTLICTGSSDGSVRIWRGYNGNDYTFSPHLVSACNLMPELLPNRQGSGMILIWDQNQCKFYVTSDQNDIRIIKVWDAASESKVQDIPTCAEFGVSCLSSDGEHSIAAGFLDGSIRIYDTRLRKTDCRTSTFRKHSENILGLHMFKPGEKHINLVSGDSGGEVRFWDKRAPTSVKRVNVDQKMSVMTVHPNADVFAW